MKSLFGAAVIALTLCGMPAQARFIATDTGDPFDPSVPINGYNSPGCASDIGGTCKPFDLGFAVNFGSGRTGKIYIYDDGQVTFGAPAGGGGATFGPGSVAGSLGDPRVDFAIYRTVFYDRIAGAFNVEWRTCNTLGSNDTDCPYGENIDLHIVPDYTAKLVNITLDTTRFYGGSIQNLGGFGYSLGSQYKALGPLDASSAFSLSVPFGVPEPATWGMLIAGFATTGVTLRRRRGLAAAG